MITFVSLIHRNKDQEKNLNLYASYDIHLNDLLSGTGVVPGRRLWYTSVSMFKFFFLCFKQVITYLNIIYSRSIKYSSIELRGAFNFLRSSRHFEIERGHFSIQTKLSLTTLRSFKMDISMFILKIFCFKFLSIKNDAPRVIGIWFTHFILSKWFRATSFKLFLWTEIL